MDWTFDRRALSISGIVALLVFAAVYAGSNGLSHFDPALAAYTGGSILTAAAVAYRGSIWLRRAPTRMYFRRALALVFRHRTLLRSAPPDTRARDHTRNHPLPVIGGEVVRNFVAQRFIRRRSSYRWIMHLCLSGGCTLAFAITFPLVFGWVHFEASPIDATIYRVSLFGWPVDEFGIHTWKAWIAFNLLNISAVIVMIGLIMAFIRRLTDAGERATQTFYEDILPLLLILAVTATGLMLTVSYKFLAGAGHSTLATVHLISVLALLFFIPFGKLFHMFQRSCALAVTVYHRAGHTGPRVRCRGCGADFASAMHVADLKTVLDQLRFNYRYPADGAGAGVHYQDICPACRRRSLALSQGAALGR
jgi:hypothetical protein